MHRSANASSSVFEMLCGLIFLALQFPTLYVNVALMLLITVEHAVAEDNRVMGRSVATATHTKAVLGVQPTHKKITATFWDLHLFDENGLIIETWNLMDNLAIMQQIGLLK